MTIWKLSKPIINNVVLFIIGKLKVVKASNSVNHKYYRRYKPYDKKYLIFEFSGLYFIYPTGIEFFLVLMTMAENEKF